MYEFLLILHNLFRWIIIATAVNIIFRSIKGLNSNTFTAIDSKSSLFFMIAADMQFLLGILLFLIFSPTTHSAFADMGNAMKNSELRFWTIEHTTMMLISWVLIHIGYAAGKKAQTPNLKHKKHLIFYGIALLLILVAIPWAFGSHARPWIRL